MKKNIENNAKLLINIAQDDFLFSPEEDQNPRFLQAFLLQACIIEGLIREFSCDLNKRNKIEGIKKPRTFNQANRESRIANGINKNTFEKLSSYINFRNELVHKLLEKANLKVFEKEINNRYLDGSEIINILITDEKK